MENNNLKLVLRNGRGSPGETYSKQQKQTRKRCRNMKQLKEGSSDWRRLITGNGYTRCLRITQGPILQGSLSSLGTWGFTVCVGSHDGFQSEKRHDPIIFLKISLTLMENVQSEANGRNREYSTVFQKRKMAWIRAVA